MRRLSGSGRGPLDAIRRFAAGGRRPIAEAVDLVVEQGSGSFVYAGGLPYLDLVSGYGVASLGHSHPRWVEAVTEQASRLAVTPLHTDRLGEYLDALGAVLPPGLGRVALTSGGAEALEMAIRLGQTATGRSGVLVFDGGFHGKTLAVRYARQADADETRKLRPAWLRTAPFPACQDHDVATYPDCEESCAAELRDLAERADLADLGCVVIEPVLGTEGNIPPKRTFLAGLRRLCDERGWILVFDESITGCGRCGRLFASDWFGVEPDVLVLGKGLGGGYPLSAVCAGEAVWDASALSAPSATSTSYGGNAIACAAGLATLEIISDEGFLAEVRAVADHAANRLVALATASAKVAQPRGVGLMLGFDLVDPVSGGLADEAACVEVTRGCRDRGLLIPAHVPHVRLTPPLTISTDEIDAAFDAMEAVLC